MAYLGVLDDIKTCINMGIPKRAPVFAISEPFDVKMFGITYAEYTRNIDKMAQSRISAVRRFDYDWSPGWPDDYVEFEPLGVKTKGEENIPLTGYEFLHTAEFILKKLRIPDFQNDGRMPAFLEVLGRIKKELGDNICLTGRIAAPFSAVSLLYGIEKTMILLSENSEQFRKTMDFLTDLAIEWGRAQIKAGADALWVGDCVASSSFISPKYYADFALKGASEVNQALKKEAFVFYHAGESLLQHLELMAETKPDALSIGGEIDMQIAKETLGKKVCIMGNIKGIEILQLSAPEIIERETIRIMEAGKKDGGYIFNSEEGIPRETPEENVLTMIQTARRHGFYG